MSWDPTTTSGAAVVVVTGLVIDGKTDNHATITAAMAAVAASPSGKGLVLLPQGAIATSALTIPTGVTLRGCGRWRIKNPGTSAPAPSSVFGTMLCPATGATYARALVTMATNSRVHTLSICGDPLSGTAGTGAPVALLATGAGVTIDQSVCVYGGSAVCVDSTPTAQDFHMNARTFQFSGAGTQVPVLGVVTSATAVATGVTTVILKGHVNGSLMVKGAPVVNLTSPTAVGNGAYVQTTPVTTAGNTKLVLANVKTAPATSASLLVFHRLGFRIAGADSRVGPMVRVAGGGAVFTGADTHVGDGFHCTHVSVNFTHTVSSGSAKTFVLNTTKGIMIGASVGITATPVTGGKVGPWSVSVHYKPTQIVTHGGSFYNKLTTTGSFPPVTTATAWRLVMTNKVWVTAVNQVTGAVTLSQTVVPPGGGTGGKAKILSFSPSVNVVSNSTLIMPDVTLDGNGMAHILRLGKALQIGHWNMDAGGTTGTPLPACILEAPTGGVQGVSVENFTVQQGTGWAFSCLARWIYNTTTKLRWENALISTSTALPHTGTTAYLWTNGRPLYVGAIFFKGVMQATSSARLPIVHLAGPYGANGFGQAPKMAGLGTGAHPAVFTPTTTGKVLVTVTGYCSTATSPVAVTMAGRWGTGTPPAKTATPTGTAFAQGTVSVRPAINISTTGNAAFTLVATITRATARTVRIWVDFTIKTNTTADKANVGHVMTTFQEVGAVV